jgi:hypothetical protein
MVGGLRRLGVALVCGTGLAACGSSANPTVGSSDFISYCQKQPQYTQASLDCRCVQQKLQAAGYGSKRVTDPSLKEAPATLVDPCVTGGAAGQSTPSTTT